MERIIKRIGLFIISIWICSCVTLRPATSIKNGKLENYKYIYITPTISLTSGSGISISGNYFSSSKSVNPSDVITGIFTKNGFIKLPELKSELAEETLIINYGESGKRYTGLGAYTIEVTIQFVSPQTNSIICSCTAEGYGSTESDGIRKAITRCINELTTKIK